MDAESTIASAVDELTTTLERIGGLAPHSETPKNSQADELRYSSSSKSCDRIGGLATNIVPKPSEPELDYFSRLLVKEDDSQYTITFKDPDIAAKTLNVDYFEDGNELVIEVIEEFGGYCNRHKSNIAFKLAVDADKIVANRKGSRTKIVVPKFNPADKESGNEQVAAGSEKTVQEPAPNTHSEVAQTEISDEHWDNLSASTQSTTEAEELSLESK